jgi:hypothetical protein
VPRVVECQGAPRDLGLDQGAACAALLVDRGPVRSAGGGGRRSALARAAAALRAAGGLRRVAPDAEVAAVARDLERHFPQLAERLDGLARGAGVERSGLLAALRAELGRSSIGDPEVAAGPALALRSGGGARALVVATVARGRAVLRRSRPENGLRSLEWVAPWGVGGLAGVNEAGLAAACAPGEPSTRGWPRCAAPASLLVQECLQRFSDVDGATAWCRGRPAGGAACVLLADAAGAIAEVRIDGEQRGVASREAALLASPGPAAGALVAAAKALQEADAASDSAVAAALAAVRGSACAEGTPAALVLDPAAREIAWSEGDTDLVRVSL